MVFFHSYQDKQPVLSVQLFQCEDEPNDFIFTLWELAPPPHPFLLETGSLWLTKSLSDLNLSAEW